MILTSFILSSVFDPSLQVTERKEPGLCKQQPEQQGTDAKSSAGNRRALVQAAVLTA